MPDPSHRPYQPMTIVKPNAKPALWWLYPWSYARTLHTAANALRALTDRQDKALEMQAHIIVDQSEEITNLRRRVEDLLTDLGPSMIPRSKDSCIAEELNKRGIGLTTIKELWESRNGKAVGSDDTWEAYCQRRKDDIDKMKGLI